MQSLAEPIACALHKSSRVLSVLYSTKYDKRDEAQRIELEHCEETVHLSGLKSTEMSLRRMAELHMRRQLRCCAARPQILFEIFDLTRKAGKRRQASVKRSGGPFGGGSYVYDANH